jgi:hypothetical protein
MMASTPAMATALLARHLIAHELIWQPCPMCWGQRVQYAMDNHGRLAWRRPCPTCLGLGDVPANGQ